MEEIKIILLCSSRFAFPAMQNFAYNNQLGAVVIPVHCSEMIDETKEALKGSDIPVIIVDKKNLEKKIIDAIETYKINVGFVFTFSYIIPEKVYSATKKGFYNVHPGPLPSYRGADPIFYQIKNRERYAAVAIHHLDSGADTGAVILQESIRLHSTDTYGILTMKLSQLAVQLAGTVIKILALGFVPPSKPQEETDAHYYKVQELHEITIDWDTMDAVSIVALINACNPHNKGAATRLNNKLIRFLVAENADNDINPHALPGTIIRIDDTQMDIATFNNQLLSVMFLYIDEGFVTPAYLINAGVGINMLFQKVF